MVIYTANRIGFESIDDVLIAGVSNELVGYVLFQRGLTAETDHEEPPYFEYDDQTNGGTDLIKSVELTEKYLTICTTKISSNFEKFQITLDTDTKVIKELSSQLKKIFKGHESKLQIKIA